MKYEKVRSLKCNGLGLRIGVGVNYSCVTLESLHLTFRRKFQELIIDYVTVLNVLLIHGYHKQHLQQVINLVQPPSPPQQQRDIPHPVSARQDVARELHAFKRQSKSIVRRLKRFHPAHVNTQ